MAQPGGTSGLVRIRSFEVHSKGGSLPKDYIPQEAYAEDLRAGTSFPVVPTARQKQLRYLVLILCIALLLVVPLPAQKTSGTIRGLVTDPSGAVVPSTVVVIHSDETGSTRTVNTNSQGEYIAPELPAGTYTIT